MFLVRILVVDDDRAVRDALRRALTLGGYEVLLAEGGQQGLTEIATGLPDAVVLDVGMPGLDGLEVCRRLRGAGNRVPVLMLPRATRSPIASTASTPGPTTISSSRSTSAS